MVIPAGNDEKLKRIPWATAIIIIVNTLIFLKTESIGFHAQAALFNDYGFTTAQPSIITPFTSMFLHFDIFHIFGNMLF